MNAYGMEASEVTNVSDMLIQTQSRRVIYKDDYRYRERKKKIRRVQPTMIRIRAIQTKTASSGDKQSSVETGDSTNLVIWTALMMISVLGAVLSKLFRRRTQR